MKNFIYCSPKKIIYGFDILGKLGEEVKLLGSRALIVTGRSSTKMNGSLDKVCRILNEANVSTEVFNQVESDPSVKTVELGVEICKQFQPDIILALGGGSPLDAAKIINLVYCDGGKVSEYLKREPEKQLLPFVAVPTTAGTGSEVTKYAVITDTENKIKMLIGGNYLIPDIAFLDPELTVSMPPSVTAATGLDALTHAIEAYISNVRQPLTDELALSAVKKISGNLIKAIKNGSDINARFEMLFGQMQAGLAFSNASVALVHSMSRPLGAYFGIPHGLANALLLPHVMNFNRDACQERFAVLAQAMGQDTAELSRNEASKLAVIAVQKLFKETGLPNNLAEVNVKEELIPNMAQDAFESGSTKFNPRVPAINEIKEIYQKAMLQW